MSEQVKLPAGARRFTPRNFSALIPDPDGTFIHVDFLDQIITQRDKEWREALLGDEALDAFAAPFADYENTYGELWKVGMEAAIDKAAPDGGGE